MFKNYFKIAWRNLWKNKGYSLLNIGGLSIGMAAAILILIWVNSELSYDRFYAKKDQLYIVGNKDIWNDKVEVWFSTPKPMASAIKTEFPEIKNVSRVSSADGFLMSVDEKKIVAGAGIFVDSAFLNMFDFPVLAGDVKQALRKPTEMILTESLALSLFGSTDVVGKIVKLDSVDNFTIGAVLKEMPSNTIFKNTKYILPWSYMEKLGFSDDNWGNNSVSTFVEVEKTANSAHLAGNFKDFTKRHSEATRENVLKSVSDMWLYGKYENGNVVGGRIEMVRVFFLIACFILLIACINFMNLSTAQSEKRAKEVGVRKVVGAQKVSLINQFLTESIVLALISGALAILLVLLSLSAYSSLVDRKLSIDFTSIEFWLFFIGFILATGLLAGSYPAFFLSSFQPIKVLKGRIHHVAHKVSARKILVVVQFCIAVILIICTLVIRKQIQYGQDRESGYGKDKLIYVLDQGEINKKFPLIKQALLEQGVATSISRMMSPLTQRWSNSSGFYWEGKSEDNSTIFNRTTADDNIVKTAGFTLLAGRDFDLSIYPTDSSAVILNETAAKAMNFKDPIGKIIKDNGRDWQVIGVIKDFIQESPYEAISPLVIEGAYGWTSTSHIKFAPNLSLREALDKTEKIFKKFNPDYPFEYEFIDESYALKFEESKQIGKLSTLFAGLTIFISCLGLFGLAAYMAENRTKEIGIRKVLGASVLSITNLLTKEFMLLVSISCLIAFPIAYWAMDMFLGNYQYRITLGWSVFIIAGLGALVIALITVSSQAIRAAIANPVDNLRDE